MICPIGNIVKIQFYLIYQSLSVCHCDQGTKGCMNETSTIVQIIRKGSAMQEHSRFHARYMKRTGECPFDADPSLIHRGNCLPWTHMAVNPLCGVGGEIRSVICHESYFSPVFDLDIGRKCNMEGISEMRIGPRRRLRRSTFECS